MAERRLLNQDCLTTLFLICFTLIVSSPATQAYDRPPPRSDVFTPHYGSRSDPQQVHISLAGKDHVRVSWVTKSTDVPSEVEYGTSPGAYNTSATGRVTSYRYMLVYKSGQIHHVKIGPLNPKTTYYYRCGGQGPEFSFVTPPSTYPIEFAVADLGQTEWTRSTLAHIGKQDYDVLLLPGDLSYADMFQPRWDSFGRLVEPYASKRPWMVTEGNHEVESVVPLLHVDTFKAYNARWPMPFEESGSTSNLYYSFDVVGAHIIMLGSYTKFDAGSEQYTWLKADLAKVDRSATPWLIVLIHAPWYNTNQAHRGEGEKMRIAMEKLLYEARVDIVFAGHVHAYERFTRVHDNKADPCGPIHITIGDGGNREGLAKRYLETGERSISAFREASFGHGRLRLTNETHAQWSWHRNDDAFSNIADEVSIENLGVSQTCTSEV
uniref:Purple acid phosphatase n=1 Tax=Kalanchoe fedtschenkoi TaxID=63787 RepID=A0A7N0UBV4_KALFE